MRALVYRGYYGKFTGKLKMALLYDLEIDGLWAVENEVEKGQKFIRIIPKKGTGPKEVYINRLDVTSIDIVD